MKSFFRMSYPDIVWIALFIVAPMIGGIIAALIWKWLRSDGNS